MITPKDLIDAYVRGYNDGRAEERMPYYPPKPRAYPRAMWESFNGRDSYYATVGDRRWDCETLCVCCGLPGIMDNQLVCRELNSGYNVWAHHGCKL